MSNHIGTIFSGKWVGYYRSKEGNKYTYFTRDAFIDAIENGVECIETGYSFQFECNGNKETKIYILRNIIIDKVTIPALFCWVVDDKEDCIPTIVLGDDVLNCISSSDGIILDQWNDKEYIDTVVNMITYRFYLLSKMVRYCVEHRVRAIADGAEEV